MRTLWAKYCDIVYFHFLQKLVNPLLTKLLVIKKFVWNMIFSSSIYLFFFFHEKCCQMNMKKCHILEDFRFLAQKRPPEKKFKKNASLYLMNFDYLSYESNLLILGHPHICDRGGAWASTLYSVHRCIYIYIYIYIYISLGLVDDLNRVIKYGARNQSKYFWKFTKVRKNIIQAYIYLNLGPVWLWCSVNYIRTSIIIAF